MLRKISRLAVFGLLCSVFIIMNCTVASAAGQVIYSRRSQKVQASVNGAPSTYSLKSDVANVDLDGIVQSANLTSLPFNLKADPILSVIPMVYYDMRNAAGTIIAGGANTNEPDSYVYNKDGFQQLYLDHAGVARYYYRAYSETNGWSPWCNTKEATPFNQDGSRISAIQIRVKGYTYQFDDIYYKVVLSDGTVTDWASNGQTCGAMGNDRYIVALKIVLWNRENPFPQAKSVLMLSDCYEGAYRASDGNIQYSTYDGRAFTGTAFYENTMYMFINNMPAQGWQYYNGYKYYCNTDGSVVDDLEPIMGLQSSYQIKYNKPTATMYVMALDPETNTYIIPFKTFISTCGVDTPIGNFSIYQKHDWKFMHNSEDDGRPIYCQKLSRFKEHFLIHSLLYYGEPNPFTLDAICYNYIDDACSGGCIRLRACDADWVYTNIPMHTPVTVYIDQWNKGPIEKDTINQVIPRDQTYDPTDATALAVLQGQMSKTESQGVVVDDGEVIE